MTQNLKYHKEASQEKGLQSPYRPKDQVKDTRNNHHQPVTQIITKVSHHHRLSVIQVNQSLAQ